MKKYTIALTLTVMGMAGCKNSKTVEFAPTAEQKVDTALVLGKLHSSHIDIHTSRFVVVNKKGEVVRFANVTKADPDIYDFANVGDTVIITTDKSGNVNIAKNLTMENKIKAFTKQR
ncbi:MAG: hypothetical protein NC311_04260 [Muribaculaceae bacterium]|nr:hypothetical protein [Muribaculaceae bacterium]